MFNIDATLEYIESVKNTFLSSTDSREISARIMSIKKKRKDSKLYLAVIGEFSSGKSTFINALLGFRLLKDAVMPTTACATYIESHARFLAIEIVFNDGSKFQCSESNFDAIREYILAKYSINCIDIHQVITVVTSDQKVARCVSKMNIKVPGNRIPKNIVIIDTPGFNPGSSSVDNHQEITKDVVENIADAAIILTPQEQAMSATLSRFLKANLKRCLHRCTYVVTKFDLPADDTTRNEILDYARQRIEVDLGISNPRLYGLSAATMLPVKRVPLGKEYIWPILQNIFANFMKMSWTQLQSSKEYVLSEHVNILIKDVAKLCVEKLNRKEQDLKSDKSFLESHKVETIKSVCDKMVATASNAIYDTISSIHYSFTDAEYSSRSISESIINSGSISLSTFQSSMMPKIKGEVEYQASRALSLINNSVNSKVADCVRRQISKMSQVFSSHYSQFPMLKPKESAPSVNLIKFKYPNLNFSIAVSKIEALDSKENRAAGGGAAGGAAIGAMFGGPIGALVGAGIGFFGGRIAGDQSDSMRSSAIPLVKNEISSFFSSLRIKVDNEISSIRTQYSNLIKRFAQEHISAYGAAVQKLISEHQRKIQDLNNQITNLRNAINLLQNVQNDVEHELAILKIK